MPYESNKERKDENVEIKGREKSERLSRKEIPRKPNCGLVAFQVGRDGVTAATSKEPAFLRRAADKYA